MPTWLVLLLLIELIILVSNPSEADYAWLQGLRRPGWLRFHVWSPLIRLACYAGVYLSLLLIHQQDARWGWVFAYLGLIFLSEIGVWITCQMRSLTLGSSCGVGAGLGSMALAYLVHPLNPFASLALIPFLAWSVVDNLAQLQMKDLNGLSLRRERPRPTGAPLPSPSPSPSPSFKDLVLRLGRHQRPR